MTPDNNFKKIIVKYFKLFKHLWSIYTIHLIFKDAFKKMIARTSNILPTTHLSKKWSCPLIHHCPSTMSHFSCQDPSLKGCQDM
jgi:hypothetical protein